MYRSIEWRGDSLRLLDQKKLPHLTEYVDLRSYQEVVRAIQDMTVRGAPAIGISGAFAVVLAAMERSDTEWLASVAKEIRCARPTAVNLGWAIDRMTRVLDEAVSLSGAGLQARLLSEAIAIFDEDAEVCRAIGRYGDTLVAHGAKLLHHCNTGSLATAEYGTALGIIRTAHESGKAIHAYLDETRPRLQGASLSAWELKALGVPHTVIVDSASGALMRAVGIDMCVVGCDRVAMNGDTANKIGTYNLALVANAHRVPFYVAAPLSTLDPNMEDGSDIEIEERSPHEVLEVQGRSIAPLGTPVWNPAFDVTPGDLITAIITERGIAYPPYTKSLRRVLEG